MQDSGFKLTVANGHGRLVQVRGQGVKNLEFTANEANKLKVFTLKGGKK